jgi:hypothetical protein
MASNPLADASHPQCFGSRHPSVPARRREAQVEAANKHERGLNLYLHGFVYHGGTERHGKWRNHWIRRLRSHRGRRCWGGCIRHVDEAAVERKGFQSKRCFALLARPNGELLGTGDTATTCDRLLRTRGTNPTAWHGDMRFPRCGFRL